MNEIDPVNIPAFQRKRSIAAKLRPKRKKAPSRLYLTRKIRAAEPIEELILEPELPSEELFPDPLMEDGLARKSKKSLEFREMKICGRCDGYFDKIEVAVIQVTSPVRKGDIIIFEKDDGLFQQPIDSMQMNHKDISLARSGYDIGLKVCMKPKVGTPVYKVI